MDYVIGQHLSLLVPAIDPVKQDEILFDSGTLVEIVSINLEKVGLKFPDGIIYAHDTKDLPFLFKSVQSNILTKSHSGVGTPPKSLFGFLPSKSDWKKNYIWKLNITLEELSEKTVICQDCTTEILDFDKKNTSGQIWCSACKEYIIPFDLVNNKPYLELESPSSI